MKNQKFLPRIAPSLLTVAMALSCAGLVQAQEGANRSADEDNPRASATAPGNSATRDRSSETNDRANTGVGAGASTRAANAGNTSSEVPTDGQILQIVRTLNMGEIAQAEMARDESDNAKVKEVADMIIADHTSSNEQIEQLEETGDNLELDDSMTSDSLESLAKETSAALADLSGAAFDCAYLQKQADMHQLALTTVSTQLMPAAKDEQVKAFLSMSSPKLEHHLQMAKDAQQGMNGCAAGGSSNQQSGAQAR